MRIDTAELSRSAHRKQDFIVDGLPQIAFVGRSNVGKSSLMNRLLGRKGLARTSNTPGRTRSINYFIINQRFYFVDLPGYGYAKASKTDRNAWAMLVEGYLATAPANTEVLQLVDGKVGATALDVQAHEYLSRFDIEPTVVATKIDRVPRGKRAAQMKAIAKTMRAELDPAVGEGDNPELQPIPVSARSGDGIKELWARLDRNLG